jgi:hypothetical protein
MVLSLSRGGNGPPRGAGGAETESDGKRVAWRGEANFSGRRAGGRRMGRREQVANEEGVVWWRSLCVCGRSGV